MLLSFIGDQEMAEEGEADINEAEGMNDDSDDDDIGPAHMGQFGHMGHGIGAGLPLGK